MFLKVGPANNLFAFLLWVELTFPFQKPNWCSRALALTPGIVDLLRMIAIVDFFESGDGDFTRFIHTKSPNMKKGKRNELKTAKSKETRRPWHQNSPKNHPTAVVPSENPSATISWHLEEHTTPQQRKATITTTWGAFWVSRAQQSPLLGCLLNFGEFTYSRYIYIILHPLFPTNPPPCPPVSIFCALGMLGNDTRSLCDGCRSFCLAEAYPRAALGWKMKWSESLVKKNILLKTKLFETVLGQKLNHWIPLYAALALSQQLVSGNERTQAPHVSSRN